MNSTRVLLVRVDRLGDLVVTLPVEDLEIFKNKKVTWLIPKGFEFLFSARKKTNFFSIDKKKTKENFLDLLKWLKEYDFDEVVIFHAPAWIYFAIWCARIKKRMGVYSQWYSFLTLTRGIRQKRSEAQFHELEYNRKLVLDLYNIKEKDQRLKPLSLSHPKNPEARSYVVIHPGMMGSARNWPLSHYKKLIELLSSKTHIIISGSTMDKAWTQPLKQEIREFTNIEFQDEISSALDWLQLLGNASCVIAPSTGTLHIAASLGVPSVGIYSPIKVQAPRRWAPLGKKVHTFVPHLPCPADHQCWQEKCPYYDCMKQITVEAVAKHVLDILT